MTELQTDLKIIQATKRYVNDIRIYHNMETRNTRKNTASALVTT